MTKRMTVKPADVRDASEGVSEAYIADLEAEVARLRAEIVMLNRAVVDLAEAALKAFRDG